VILKAPVEFVTGRGRAGFYRPGRALTMSWGAYFGGDSRPGQLSGAGRGIGPGAHVFRGPRGPITNTSHLSAAF